MNLLNKVKQMLKPTLETYVTDVTFCSDFLGKQCFIANFSEDPFSLQKSTRMMDLKDVYLDGIEYRGQWYDLHQSYIGNDIYVRKDVSRHEL